MPAPQVSVIVPYRNAAAYLEACLLALQEQDVEPESYEIILVDNGSQDGSADIVARHSMVLGLHEPKPGAYAARNRGLLAARGELVLFTDADCLVAPDWVRHLTGALVEADLVLGVRLFPPGPGLAIISDFENARAAAVVAGRKDAIFGFTNNMGVRRDLFRRAGPFRPMRRGGDTEFVNRCVTLDPATRVSFVSEAWVKHLEIRHGLDWLWRLYAYGQAHGQILATSRYRPATWLTVLGVAGRLIRKQCYSPWQVLQLLAYLGLGKLFFLAGRLTRPQLG